MTDLVRAEAGHVVTIESPLNQTLALIGTLARDPGMTAEKLEVLLKAAERFDDKEAQQQFNDAVARIQPLLPAIEKNGAITYGEGAKARNTPYALLEDVQTALLPILAPEGLSLSFSSEETPTGKTQYVGYLKHRRGHTAVARIVLPPDDSGQKNKAQQVISSASLAKRELARSLLNLRWKGKDTDGSTAHYVSDEQLAKIEEAIEKCKMTQGERASFEQFMGVAMTGDIPARDFEKALTQLRDFHRRKFPKEKPNA